MNETTKRYLVSSLITFLTGFALAVLPVMDSLTLDNVQGGALLGVLFMGARAGFKALIEFAVKQVSK